MRIIIKFILKNIYGKKLRTILILVSIMLSSALFFASNAIQETSEKMYTDRMKQYYGNSEILVYPNQKSPSQFFTKADITSLKDKIDYSIGFIQGSANFKASQQETVNFQLYAFKTGDLQRYYQLALYNSPDLNSFQGNKVIISKNTAEKYGLCDKEKIDLNINGTRIKFTISALAYPTGPFLDESQTQYAIVPLETLGAIYNARGRVNMVGIKTLDPQLKQGVIKELSAIYKRYVVCEPFSVEDLRQQTSSMTTTFMLMSVIVMLMSIFIIYTSFKVVTMERLPVIGTFRSIGATKKMTDGVLLLESIIYGIIGGIAGCITGIGVLYVMSYFIRPVGIPGMGVVIDFSWEQLLTAFVLAVILSFISCILPIIKISRIPVKEIILNVMQKVPKRRTIRFIIGFVLMTAAVIIPQYVPPEPAIFVDTICMILSVIALVILVPFITSIFVKILGGLYLFIFGNIGILAVKNLKDNKSILNNISLLAIGISSLLMINTISSNVVTIVTNVYGEMNYDIWMTYVWHGDRNFEGIVRRVDGVTGTYGIYQSENVELEGRGNYRIALVQGIDATKYRDYCNISFRGDAGSLIKQLDAGKNIILSGTIKDKFRLSCGDTVRLRLNQKARSYKIIGFMDSLMYNGSCVLISENNLKMDTGSRYYDSMWIKTSKSPDTVLKELDKQLGQRPHSMKTMEEMENQNQQSNNQIFHILKGFSLMALVIGIFGVLNNLIISFIERKRSLAMLQSVGMSKAQIIGMIFIEALSGGLIGGITGVAAGFLLLRNVPFVLKAINLPLEMPYPFQSIPVYVAAGILITVIASVFPGLKASKLGIIEAIKYE